MLLTVLEDLAARNTSDVVALLARATEADGHDSIGEHKWLDLVHGGRDVTFGIRADIPGHDHLVGWAQAGSDEGHHWGLEVVVDPQHRGVGIEAALVGRVLEEISNRGGGHVHWWVFRPSEIHEAVAHTCGLTRGRTLLAMTRPLPLDAPPPPADYTVTTFDFERDAHDWVEVNNRAFGGHPEQGQWTIQTLKTRAAQPWFDPQGFVMLRSGTELAGFCWTKIHQAGVGEIYVIATNPDYAGRGLGRALVGLGAASLHERGCSRIMLYVDAENEPAVGLYTSMGFEKDHHDCAYVIDL